MKFHTGGIDDSEIHSETKLDRANARLAVEDHVSVLCMESDACKRRSACDECTPEGHRLDLPASLRERPRRRGRDPAETRVRWCCIRHRSECDRPLMAPPYPVLLMSHSLDAGGSERQLTEIARNLDRSRFTPHVACFRDGGMRLNELLRAGVPVLPLAISSFRSLGALRAVGVLGRYVR